MRLILHKLLLTGLVMGALGYPLPLKASDLSRAYRLLDQALLTAQQLGTHQPASPRYNTLKVQLNAELGELRSLRRALPSASQKRVLTKMARRHRQLYLTPPIDKKSFAQVKLGWGVAFVGSFLALDILSFIQSPYTQVEDSLELLSHFNKYTMAFLTFGIGLHSAELFLANLSQSLTRKIIHQMGGSLYPLFAARLRVSPAATQIWGKSFFRMSVGLAVGLMLNSFLYQFRSDSENYWGESLEYASSVLAVSVVSTPAMRALTHYLEYGKRGFRAFRVTTPLGLLVAAIDTAITWALMPQLIHEARDAGKIEGGIGWEMNRGLQMAQAGTFHSPFPRRDTPQCTASLHETSPSGYFRCIHERLWNGVKIYFQRQIIREEIGRLKGYQEREAEIDQSHPFATGRMGHDFKVFHPARMQEQHVDWRGYQNDMKDFMGLFQDFRQRMQGQYVEKENLWFANFRNQQQSLQAQEGRFLDYLTNTADDPLAMIEQSQAFAQERANFLSKHLYGTAEDGYAQVGDMASKSGHSLRDIWEGTWGQREHPAGTDMTGSYYLDRLLHVAQDSGGLHRNFNLYDTLRPDQLLKAYASYLNKLEHALDMAQEGGPGRPHATDELKQMRAEVAIMKGKFEAFVSTWLWETAPDETPEQNPANINLAQSVAFYHGAVFNEVGYPGLEPAFAYIRSLDHGGDFLGPWFSSLDPKETSIQEAGSQLKDRLAALYKYSYTGRMLQRVSMTLQVTGPNASAEKSSVKKVLHRLASRTSHLLLNQDVALSDPRAQYRINSFIWDLLWLNRHLLSRDQNSAIEFNFFSDETSACRRAWQAKFESAQHLLVQPMQDQVRYLKHPAAHGAPWQNSADLERNPYWQTYREAMFSIQVFRLAPEQNLGITPQYLALGNLMMSKNAFISLLETFEPSLSQLQESCDPKADRLFQFHNLISR